MTTTKGSRKPKPQVPAFPERRELPVKVRRVTGEGAEQTIEWEDAVVVAFDLPIGRMFGVMNALGPMLRSIRTEGDIFALLTADPDAFIRATAIAINWPEERVAAMSPGSFLTVVCTLVELNRNPLGLEEAKKAFTTLMAQAQARAA